MRYAVQKRKYLIQYVTGTLSDNGLDKDDDTDDADDTNDDSDTDADNRQDTDEHIWKQHAGLWPDFKWNGDSFEFCWCANFCIPVMLWQGTMAINPWKKPILCMGYVCRYICRENKFHFTDIFKCSWMQTFEFEICFLCPNWPYINIDLDNGLASNISLTNNDPSYWRIYASHGFNG